MTDAPLPRDFFDRPVLEVAPDLLGRLLVHDSPEGRVALRLTEVEAYDGANDPGSHAFRGRTSRNAVMFGPPGFVYVYFTYGMHWCMNLVCGPEGAASAVLMRAGEIVVGDAVARARRTTASSARDLARGPARLTTALGVGKQYDGADATDPLSLLRVLPGEGPQPAKRRLRRGPRVGVAGDGAARRWRFWIDGEPTVSAYRPAVSRRRAGTTSGRLGPAGTQDTPPPAEPTEGATPP
ncbi:MAG: DNA-3-methyladenine glycosylase [Actinomycetes bacterium]